MAKVTRDDEITVGKSIVGHKLYLLDHRLQPVLPGETGEAYVAGPQLARGYLHDAALTAERFVADPFAHCGGRMYRTGDIGRLAMDGGIELLGRGDDQVHVRGFRVEPAEIEQVIEDDDSVERAVVALKDFGPERRLVAFIVPKREQIRCHVEEILKRVADRLPAYMVPASVHVVTELPFLASGKVDRVKLAASAESRPQQTSTDLEPRTETETWLARIWAEVLGLDSVSVHENFFNAGGDSLLAMQVLSRLSALKQVELAIETLFENPTVETLARAIDAERY
jgi:acyl-coenzyme A synthetase/AMP-(fatty) acid ligase/aryl carrier-like protein